MLHRFAAAYRGLPAATWLLSAAAFVNRTGTMVVPYLTLYLTERHGFSAAEAGAFVSLYGVGSIAGNALGGVLCDRIGALRTQALSLFLTALVFLLLAALRAPWAIGATLVLLGVVHDAFRPGNLTAIAGSAPAELRSRAFALNRLAVNAGWAIGPALGGLLAKADYLWLFLADAATAALAGLWLVAVRVRLRPVSVPMPPGGAAAVPPPPLPPRGRAASPLRDGPFLLLLLWSGVASFTYLLFFGLAPLYLHEVRGLDKPTIGLLLVLNPAVITVTEMVLVHRLRAQPPLRLVALGSLLLGVGLGLTPLSPHPAWLCATILLWTVGEMLQAPALAAFIGSRAPEHARGRYLGAYGTTFSVAWMVAPVLGTQCYQRLGPDTVWWLALACGLAAAAGFTVLARNEGRRARGGPQPP